MHIAQTLCVVGSLYGDGIEHCARLVPWPLLGLGMEWILVPWAGIL